MRSQRQEFIGADGHKLAARLDGPEGDVRAYALFAHCFTCGKDVFAASRIAQALTEHGIAVLRFDFTGLGASEGEFANTNFSSNLQDLVAAADFMRVTWQAPRLLIGHSLGGAAVLAAASEVPEVKAVVTLAAPSHPANVTEMFSAHLDEIAREGEAHVQLAGRPFRIRQQFVDDAGGHNLKLKIAALKRALLVMHAPGDDTVPISNAMEIFTAAKHPKSFVSLDSADHLLTDRADAVYVANLIAAWSDRYIG
jgi:alpha/beta superfamily hydrolase